MMNVKRLMELVRPAPPPGVAGEPAGNGKPVRRSSRAAAVDLAPLGDTLGAGGGWANPEYGAYYATSVSVYAAVKLRGRRGEPPAGNAVSPQPGGNQNDGGPGASGAATAQPGQPLVQPGATCGGLRRFT